MKSPAAAPWKSISLLLTIALLLQSLATGALAEETAVDPPTPEKSSDPASKQYHTPLAGESGTYSLFGHKVSIPEVDRSHITSLTLGGTVLFPEQGTLNAVPIGALYLRRVNPTWRTLDVISIFDNDAEIDRTYDRFEWVGLFESYTIPADIREIRNGQQIKPTTMIFGDLIAGVGPGVRVPVAPFDVDNDMRLQLLGRLGYMYAERDNDTGPNVVVPPNTVLYGTRLRGRYDGMTRNLLELPHRGIATGFDLDYMHRNEWVSLSPGQSVHRNYVQLSGFLVGAGGIPGLSERNRVVAYLMGGSTLDGNGDRFNAFRINGGPYTGESQDMARKHYLAPVYQDVRTTSYASATLGYRRELLFFLYLSVFGSYIWSDRATVIGEEQIVFRGRSDWAGTASLDSGFIWNSSLNLSYSWDTGFVRNGRSGNGIMLLWNKAF